MLKHQPPHGYFAAVDNNTVDDLNCFLAKGLLLTLVRQRPGEDMTVEKLAKSHKQGRQAVEAAMRTLVQHGLVVKLKIQSIHGNRWRTVFTVSDRPIPAEFVKDWIDSIDDAQAIRVEPAHLDPRSEGKNEKGRSVFPTTTSQRSGNRGKSAGQTGRFPTAANPTVGAPTAGDAAAKEETVFTQYGGDEVAKTEDSLTGSAGKPALPRGESEPGGRPSIEEITGPGAAVAHQGRPKRPAGHGTDCICPACPKPTVPQQASGAPSQAPGAPRRSPGTLRVPEEPQKAPGGLPQVPEEPALDSLFDDLFDEMLRETKERGA